MEIKYEYKEAVTMETKNIIFKLRTKKGMSQDELIGRKNNGNETGSITLGKR